MTHPLFTVSSTEIQQLDDEQARELVARLCQAEANKLEAEALDVTWGGDQRAKDGGVDVRFKANRLPTSSTYLPSANAGFQVKAEPFPPAKIGAEMAPKGAIREAIKELALVGGSYLIVSTRDSTSDSALKARIEAMNDTVATYGVAGKLHLDFLDSRRIASWVEQYPALVIWTKTALGKPHTGWRPYGPWAYREDDPDAVYLLDDKVKVFTPNTDTGTDVLTAINAIRSELALKRTVRLVGLSGVGKTRMVQALFDNRIVTNVDALAPDTAVYADLSDQIDPQPTAMIEALCEGGRETVVVVDNCGQDVHSRLAELLAKSSAPVSLITIEYDIRDDLPEGTTCYRLEGTSEEVIKELLKRRHSYLSNNDVERIAEFSDGNARVAFALASASERADDLARLGDEALFRRLFHQKHTESEELLIAAEIASLLYSFDGEDTSNNSELSRLANIADVSTSALYRNIAELQRRGLVQQRGRWRAVLPHAIANRLAARALANYPHSLVIKALLTEAPDRMARSFSRRLGYLHGSEDARTIVAGLLSPGGRLNQLETLDEVGKQILKNVTPVDPSAALGGLESAISRGEFQRLHHHAIRDFVLLARLIAYEPAMFERALAVLLALGKCEDQKEQSKDVIASLFTCHLSGTHAPPEMRANLVMKLLSSTDDYERRTGLSALDQALEAEHFSSHYEFDFGSRKRDYGWSPRTGEDVKRWYNSFIETALEAVRTKPELKGEVTRILGQSFRSLCRSAGMFDELEVLTTSLLAEGDWPEGWIGVRETLYWGKDKLPSPVLQRLKELERLLAPKDLSGLIRGKVLTRGASTLDFLEDDDEGKDSVPNYLKAQNEAERLGQLAAADFSVWTALLPELFSDTTTDKSFRFGVGLGKGIRDPHEFLAELRKIITSLGAAKVNMIPLRGFLSGWHSVDPEGTDAFLDDAIADDVWGPWFPELQCAIGLEGPGAQRIMQSLSVGLAPDHQYRYLSLGRATSPLDIETIGELISGIASLPTGPATAIDVLGMAAHSAHEQGEQFVQDLATFIRSFFSDLNLDALDTRDPMADHHLDQLLTFALTKNEASEADGAILNNFIRWEKSKGRVYAYRRGQFLKPFFKLRPMLTLNAIYVPDDDGSYQTAYELAANRDSDRDQRPMASVPTDQALEWCNASPEDRYTFLAETCLLYAPGEGPKRLSSIALALFQNAPDKESVLSAYVARLLPMSWSGSRAAKLRERLSIFDELSTSSDDGVSQLVAAHRSRLEEIAARMEREEAEEERSQNATFE